LQTVKELLVQHDINLWVAKYAPQIAKIINRSGRATGPISQHQS